MGRISWSEPALDDVRQIVEYVARDSRRYAVRLAERLLDAPRSLAENPLSGGIVAEFNRKKLREILVRPYRIIYLVRSEECFVITVIHGSRNLKWAFQHPDDQPSS